MKDLTGLRTEEDLDIYLLNYNWDDGFDIPAAILQKECCTLQVALQIFWLADGFTYLQEKEIWPSLIGLHLWIVFIETSFLESIKSANCHLSPNLTKSKFIGSKSCYPKKR